MNVSMISVIIPVLNEVDQILSTVARVQQGKEVEIIVVDGGSTDGTVESLKQEGIKVIQTTPGRGHQMNEGARNARGEYLLFLHGDTRLPREYDEWVRDILPQPEVVAGAFELRIGSENWGYRMVEWGVKWRSHLCQLPYGDQAIFLSRARFEQVGGFPELPILEDWHLIQSLKPLGKIAIAPLPVVTSARRWQRLGIWRTTAINQGVLIANFLGVDLHRIARWYRKIR
ncbi:MAG: TIGR04283 family arsenosugar biosynthesis glycosyltransferase [Roseofilum sp. SBFL]|uniref:TIGR04283 family arsenosugar biosynthesis glycosyltransferase n=1 Tax=unclassified Roseofilum TaxID=2620099 RepID=UPI001B17C070|nr:TIGR04283 family arsenosugar biosynthesis glycosyltransferase [Roseofilum sp. SID3]MBP0024376.1 TIGR04283 family arsenosugar biosynthesis glycosyltransferase [Roseofilum sp. SID2]MBP0037808.1 TIGR04283 family arsenosugar biosynthesis glycosyltransferase [Roseofilum sp. SID1]MBP0044918.1 TIGR04283 family arsenosugar biosynthesis glycosyltransferase [Roseofilum sp. SBFL]